MPTRTVKKPAKKASKSPAKKASPKKGPAKAAARKMSPKGPAKAKRSPSPPEKATRRRVLIPSPTDINKPPTDLTDYTLCLYGTKGIGKSTAVGSFPGSVTIMLEPMRRNLAIRMVSDSALMYKTPREIMDGATAPWEILQDLIGQCIADPTVLMINIDTYDLAYQHCMAYVCAQLKQDHPAQNNNDYGRAWTKLNEEFTATWNALRYSGKAGVTFISHAKEREVTYADAGESIPMVGPSCSGQPLQYLRSACDFMFFYGYKDNKRCVTVRDTGNSVMAASGVDFKYSDGSPMNEVFIPNDPSKFYETLNSAFQGKVKPPEKKKKTVLKKRTA